MLVAQQQSIQHLMSSTPLQQDDSRVDSTILGDRGSMTPQLRLLGLQKSSQKPDGYDSEEDKIFTQPEHYARICVTKPHNKVELGITHTVFQVVWKMNVEGKELDIRNSDRGPIRLKLVKQCVAQLFFTLEYFVCGGTPASPGSTYMICRPIDVPEEQGSTLVEGPDPSFYLRESKAFPLNDLLDKFHELDEKTWTACEDKLYGDNPTSVELLNELEMQKFGLLGVIPSNASVEAGFTLPREILVVVRPRRCIRADPSSIGGPFRSFGRTDQQTIIPDCMEVSLEVRSMEYVSEVDSLSEKQVSTSKTVYKSTTKACTRKGVQGLYSFVTSETDLETLFETSGTYLLAFSLVSGRHRNVVPAMARINVSACEEVDCWQLCSHLGPCSQHPAHKDIEARLGAELEGSLYLSGFDEYENQVTLSSVPDEVQLKIGNQNGEYLEIPVTATRELMRLVASNTALQLKGIEISNGSLALIAPTYDAHLWIFVTSVPVASYQLTVFPGEPASVALTECDRLDDCLRPGQVIQKFVFQVFDNHKNVVEKGREVCIGTEGLQMLDKQDSMRQVGEHGCLHLGGILQVTVGYNSKGTISILSDKGVSLLTLDFHTVYRSLRFSKEPGEAYIGSQLSEVEVQVIDENGNVDNKMEGSAHSLTIDWNPGVTLPLHCGTCILPNICLPIEPGTWRGHISHASHPELYLLLEVEVVSSSNELNLNFTTMAVSPMHISTPPQVQIWAVKQEYDIFTPHEEHDSSVIREDYEKQLKEFIDHTTKLQRKLREQGRKVKRSEEELGLLKRTRKEVDEMEALWKDKLLTSKGAPEELKAFETLAMSTEDQNTRVCTPSQKTNTASQVIEIVKKQGDPPGSHASSILLEAVMDNSKVFSAGGAGSDVLGIVALLASVDNDLLNRSEEGMKYLNSPDPTGWTSEGLTLHAFAHSKNRSVTGRFRVLVLDEARFYKRPDGLPSVDNEHPQKLLVIPEPGPAKGSCPEGFLGYAVNLIRFNSQQLQCYATPAKHSLRESLFFQLFSYLQVYDTKEHMVSAQDFLTTGAVSLDGGLLRANSSLEHVLGDEPTVRFPLLLEKPKSPEQDLAMDTTDTHEEKQLILNMVQVELTKKIKALHEETGYISMSLHIKKLETKLVRARSKIAAMVVEVKREEERKAEIIRKVAELRDGA